MTSTPFALRLFNNLSRQVADVIMARYSFACRDIGVNCSFKAEDDDRDVLLNVAMDHLKSAHSGYVAEEDAKSSINDAIKEVQTQPQQQAQPAQPKQPAQPVQKQSPPQPPPSARSPQPTPAQPAQKPQPAPTPPAQSTPPQPVQKQPKRAPPRKPKSEKRSD